jgi:hypothetical protein
MSPRPPSSPRSSDSRLSLMWSKISSHKSNVCLLIGTDAFVQNFIAKTCRAIIDDVEKLDAFQDGYTHLQLHKFCQTTRLQYTDSSVLSFLPSIFDLGLP